jgi:transposase-like protein
MARPTKYTTALGDKAVDAARKGVSRTAVAHKIGVARSTLYEWIALGEAPGAEDTHPELELWVTRFLEAEADVEIETVERVRGAGTEAASARVGLVYLERRFPGDWRARTSTEVSGPGGGPISHQVDAEPSHLAARVLELCAQVAGIPEPGGPGDGDLPSEPGGADGAGA